MHDFTASSVKNPEKMFLYKRSKIFFDEFVTIVVHGNTIILMAAFHLKIAYESTGMCILNTYFY